MALQTPSPAIVVALAAALFCAVLPGCKAKLSQANLGTVKPDMNPKEVESILGPPAEVETREIESTDPKVIPIVRYIYKQNGKTVTLHFVDGKLRAQDGSFDK